ncbi:hypothetical protein O3P69_004802 [Scylla paramamosain]|uniref:Uncharacterized protein n=1 Tax=Scylla paramamosain TaxID=85552 RepID=A0AAW0UF77_SCYPA
MFPCGSYELRGRYMKQAPPHSSGRADTEYPTATAPPPRHSPATAQTRTSPPSPPWKRRGGSSAVGSFER